MPAWLSGVQSPALTNACSGDRQSSWWRGRPNQRRIPPGSVGAAKVLDDRREVLSARFHCAWGGAAGVPGQVAGGNLQQLGEQLVA